MIIKQGNREARAYLVGGGIASLAAAVLLIRDAGVQGKNITIFEASGINGGSLDGTGQPEGGYVIRGGRMLNFTYYCTYDVLSAIPSLNNPSRSVTLETKEFNEQIKTHARARLVDQKGRVVGFYTLGLSERDRLDMVELLTIPEDQLGRKAITDWFRPEFFKTNFWYMWASMFAFGPWHSLAEFKRYCLRFIHEIKRINTLAGVDRTIYNQYDSIVRPMQQWLEEQGVRFNMECKVTDIDFSVGADKERTAESIHYTQDGSDKRMEVGPQGYVLVTNGSMTADSSLGSHHAAPELVTGQKDAAWTLWEVLAGKFDDFGRPENFYGRVPESKWASFTVTSKGHLFFTLMEKFTGNQAGTGALVTFKDSNWMMSVVLAYQPHFINQPADVTVFWGYGLFPDKEGNYVNKKMSECTGEEIMMELLNHLHFTGDQEAILSQANCIPCMMPYITAEFLTRARGDRPLVVPDRSVNFAFLGQFSEVPEEVVFTVEYSVRTAMTAVYRLLHVDKKPPEIYKGHHDIRVLYGAMKALYA